MGLLYLNNKITQSITFLKSFELFGMKASNKRQEVDYFQRGIEIS